ncbi:peptidyl-prolyl cis-trans isomerase [Metabacillus sp. 84]|uniref:peptidyl-prolyl cis-trans isomerase n=1 Tax=Metabacillus sp. 84 TaxID=3404705 RepID=UPI003CF33383
MNKRALWVIIAGLAVLNAATLLYFSLKEPKPAESEIAAKIGDTQITREEWLAELENRFGKDTLEQMVNAKVVQELSEEYGIKADEEMVEKELEMFKRTSDVTSEEGLKNDQQWREQIRYSILLEELLTKDVNVEEETIEEYYLENKEQYQFASAYHLSDIRVKTKAEAEEVIKALDGGSSFNALAGEYASAGEQHGDLGFLSKGEGTPLADEYTAAAEKMEEGSYSQTPIESDGGYAVLFLSEKIGQKTYSYDEVKDQIRRQLALEQMEGTVSVKPLWEEAEAEWFYGTK